MMAYSRHIYDSINVRYAKPHLSHPTEYEIKICIRALKFGPRCVHLIPPVEFDVILIATILYELKKYPCIIEYKSKMTKTRHLPTKQLPTDDWI